VAELNPLDLQGVYRKKFDIRPGDRIGAAGSCFAQHIGRHLKRSGFTWLDVEPAPPLLPPARRAAFGYELYSARYGNIYSARQLLQLAQRALGLFEPADSVWTRDGRWFDAFRPTIEPDGFVSESELLTLRRAHLRRVRQLIEAADVFVFTFGLTETWLSRRDGAAYPVCPGVEAGTFVDADYEFANFGFADVHGDMTRLLELWWSVNPRTKFLLTVSPVPLVATASPDHVMVATSFSKSVLRAVAGELARAHAAVDYFPSYELIAAPPMRGMFFAPDMREVSPSGVDHVMRHLFREHTPPQSPPPPETAPSLPMPAADDAVCDDMKLDPVS
jgi:GSCFA family